MLTAAFRHGGRAAAAFIGFAVTAYASEPTRVQSRVFDIHYDVNEAAEPLDSVQLWYTRDRGKTWHQYGLDEDRHSPVTFDTGEEGLYGFFLIVTNATGPSSTPPTSSVEPHQWAFVDFTPPVVQVHAPRMTASAGRAVLQIRWSAIDANLAPRPIGLSYRTTRDPIWQPVVSGSIANTGRYDWHVPPGLSGSVVIRVSVEDRGGHRASTETRQVEITAPTAAVETTLTVATRALSRDGPSARARAARLYAEGIARRDAKDYRAGIARMRDAIRLDPQLTAAFAEMGHMFYRIGDMDPALASFELALEQEPSLASALRGAAMVDRQQNRYDAAAKRLRSVLRYNPNDAQTWLDLGDIVIFQGDDLLAREHYLRAAGIDPAATGVIAEARRRLTLMDEVGRAFYRTSKE